MTIKIIYDNYAINEKFKYGWGFSCLINDCVLFDTGESGEALLANLKAFDVDPDQITDIIISHDHWDHTGGLLELLRISPKKKVYALNGFTDEFKEKYKDFGSDIIYEDQIVEVAPKVSLSNFFSTIYREKELVERAVIIETDLGLGMIVGCAHPGIVTMAEQIKLKFGQETIHWLLGGFHLKEFSSNDVRFIAQDLKKLKIQNIGPTHCTGEDARLILKEEFGNRYFDIAVGKEVIF